ncbi:unnamed protein product [Blepharisma stoltei]|uniref:Uncharacterized protein n=1 Tax=Blepharisma stoltei TaxID=1481888 RepID=A0AAU9KFW2_9CILI|nr:unnamed protein product [Blepharisma stoltei]
MDIPVILQDLKDYHHKISERDEIKNFKEGSRTIEDESIDQDIFDGVINKEDCVQDLFLQKLNNLLPKTAKCQKLHLFSLFAKHLDSIRVFVNIPTTILRVENISVPFLMKTLKNGAIISRPCIDNEFFKLNPKKNDDFNPIFCYKVENKEIITFRSIESAQTIWKSAKKPAIMQYYVQSFTNPASITRVLWKIGCNLKFFNIINRNLPARTKSESTTDFTPKKPTRKIYRPSSDFRCSSTFSQISKSIIANKPQNYLSTTEFSDINVTNGENDEFLNKDIPLLTKENLQRFSDNFISNEFIVNSQKPKSCIGAEIKGKFPELEKMVSEITNFLNVKVFKDDGIKGLVLDFIQDKDKNWVLIDCKECAFTNKLGLELNKIGDRKSSSLSSRRRKSSDLPQNSKNKIESSKRYSETSFTESDEKEKTYDLPFRIRSKSKEYCKPEVQEKDIIDRIHKVNEKIDRIVSHAHSTSLCALDFREQSIQAYKMRYNLRPFLSPIPPSELYECPLNSTLKIENASFIKDSLNSDKNNLCIRKHLKNVADNLDEAKFKTKLSKVNKNLSEKYGGEQFWNQFILSLYNKILANDSLTKYFKKTKLETFGMIMHGMFTIFNGMVNLEFRRNIRSSHHNLGITDHEFESYSDIFESTLYEFQIEEIDRQLMMSQVKSLKCLVTKGI